ncbi:MAG: ATP-grasp domain-containing protein [Leptospiraceae bacterium]|nr:ATP-grasp domain-containing protein [Leptospiraceae bacterium]MCP5494350.1 ATP-grasp domain-containing protein [Leptospiraceae bacterium]
MFKKVLIANRGEIAVRIIRACRDLGIKTVGVYDSSDVDSLHVRITSECVRLKSELGYSDQNEIIEIAKKTGAEAIHPGYGFLAENYEFAKACESNGIKFIGPDSSIIEKLQNKLDVLNKVKEAGFPTITHSDQSFSENEDDLLKKTGEKIGFPLIIKSCAGGRGRGTYYVRTKDELDEAIRKSRVEAKTVYVGKKLYIEKPILPVHQLGIQILADEHGNIIHLGEREGSFLVGNQKILEESPSPFLNDGKRKAIWDTAIEIAKLFGYRNAGTIEFLMDNNGNFFFTEIKQRIQVEHPLSEKITMIDIVREQLKISNGEKLSYSQEDVHFRGWSMMCRINAQDVLNNYLPSPGKLTTMRLPGGPNVRVDTYGYPGCYIPVKFDPTFAKLIVWGENREECMSRMRRALEDFVIAGIQTNLPLLQSILNEPGFINGKYNIDFAPRKIKNVKETDEYLKDMAVATAIAFLKKKGSQEPELPNRFQAGWHKSSRRLPE